MSPSGRRRDRHAPNRATKALRASIALVATLALVLGTSLLVVGCGDDSSGPEATVQKFLAAMANQDIDAIIDLTTSPEDLAALEAMGMTKDDLKYGADAEMLRSLGTLEFSDIALDTEQDGDVAVVTITGGSVTMGGMGITMDLAAAQGSGFPTEFHLNKVDGKWYIDME